MQHDNNILKKPKSEQKINQAEIKGLRTYKIDMLNASTQKDGKDKKVSESVIGSEKKIKFKMPVRKAPISTPVAPERIKDTIITNTTVASEIALAKHIREETARKEEERKRVEQAEKEKKKREEMERIKEEEAAVKRIIEEKRTKEEQVKKDMERKALEKIKLGEKILGLEKENTEILQVKDVLIKEKEAIEQVLGTVLEKESVVEKDIKTIEIEEAKATEMEVRRENEEKRWVEEAKRREIEKEKWDIEKKVEAISNTIYEKEAWLKNNIKETEGAKVRIRELDNEAKKTEVLQELGGISKTKEVFELEWIKLNDSKTEMDAIIKPIIEEEIGFENEKKIIEEKERSESNAKKRMEYERNRWIVEEKMMVVEKKRWGIEKDLIDIEEKINVLKPKYQGALAEEERLQKKLEELK